MVKLRMGSVSSYFPQGTCWDGGLTYSVRNGHLVSFNEASALQKLLMNHGELSPRQSLAAIPLTTRPLRTIGQTIPLVRRAIVEEKPACEFWKQPEEVNANRHLAPPFNPW